MSAAVWTPPARRRVRAIRDRLRRLSTYHGERGIDLSAVAVVDHGDSTRAPDLEAPLT